jgi:arginyl-tRNA synthetase
MKPVITMLEDRISAAMSVAAGGLATGRGGCIAQVRSTTDPGFGDYQVNGVMALAKELKTNPKKLAERVVEKLNVSDICEAPEIAGPGFINLRLKPEFVAANLLEVNKDHKRLGIEKTYKPKTIVVDFSGPNIAKQMHVGHLRSTIIGDCICRLLEFEGHKVVRQNHIGDWGTQFGMLIALLQKKEKELWAQVKSARTAKKPFQDSLNAPWHIEDLEEFYREAKICFDTDENFADKAREIIAGLHSGDKKYLAYWQHIVDESRKHYQPIYNELGADLKQKHECGESFYKDMLSDVVKDLKKQGLAVESAGAICVFPPGFKDKEGEPLPVIIQKSDGAYLYASTDLAAIRYRVDELKANRIIYVTDARQQLHFEMVFAVARMAGWVKNTELVHVTFGSVLGENGKPLKTRSGENVKLKELLDEAVERAKQIVEEKNPELPADKKDGIAKAVGIGAVKYADFSNNRTSDYVFGFDKMLAMDGNTAPYMQYAYARIKSIERKAQTRDMDIKTELAKVEKLSLSEPAELDLAKHLIRYGEAIEAAVGDYRPNYLTAYLYELAQKFSVFYTNCPVLDAGPDKRPTRLLLCDLTAKTIGHGLSELLGIEVVEQM